MSKRRGRKRKAVARQPNGQPSRRIEHVGQAWTPEHQQRREEAAGKGNAMRQEAGLIVGQLMLRGEISRREYEAGMLYRLAHHRYRTTQGLPPREQSARLGGIPGPDSDHAAGIARRFMAARASLSRGLVIAAVENVCLDNQGFDGYTGIAPRIVPALRTGLRQLADHFRVPDLADDGRKETIAEAA